MNVADYVITGLAGSTALTGVHQALKDRKNTPRVDLLGEQVLLKLKGDRKAEHDNKKLYYGTLAGDLISNTIYYGVIAKSKRPILTGALMGAAAGVMTVFSPQLFGLNKRYVQTSDTKKALTVGYYLLGGLAAGITTKIFKRKK
ncbi:MAG: hypothetical protein ACNS60_10200 [Candidatus Cyclobacteriaceae bacterium M2_1C_046]